MENLEYDMIRFLANMLKGQQVRQEIITQALEFICSSLSFSCGLVHEKDVTDHFCIIGHYGIDTAAIQHRYPADALTDPAQMISSEEPVTCMERGAHNTRWELELLDMYGAQTMLYAPVADENGGGIGGIVLFNQTAKPRLAEIDLELASIVLSIFVRYIGLGMYQKKLTQMQATLERVLDNAGVDIYVNDFYTHDILYTNESMAAPYGGKASFFGEKCWKTLFPGQSGPCEFCPQKKLIDENGMPTKVYSWDYQRAFDGAWFRVFSAAFWWKDGRLAHIVSSADITDNKRNESLIENLANYDQLTQLPNRRKLIFDCEQRINKATKTEQGYVLFFDIDGFKNINDSYGHDAGDEFLIQLGAFFTEVPLLKNAIYRNGGDEFVAVLGGESITKEHIRHLANFIHQRFQSAWTLRSGDVFCNTSIGVACYPEDGNTPQQLLQVADKAMYCVKKRGGGGLCFGYECADKGINKMQMDQFCCIPSFYASSGEID